MSRKTNKRITAMSRRSRSAVGTVVGTDQGLAACASHVELFEHVEDPERRPDRRHRRKAAAICGGCPLRSRCGFRVTPTDNPPTGGR
ncbi:hypothetical protein [Streptomyces marincola]|uniref:hypothetical protein n=1 Tax=Streptomyces marincola TaxID=2878388 RepID=UPI00131C6652|nr:hypothetical protein [Streptomyces marincola]